MWEKEEENVRAAGFFSGDGEGGMFGVFLGLFFGFLQSIQRKLNLDNQKKLLLP